MSNRRVALPPRNTLSKRGTSHIPKEPARAVHLDDVPLIKGMLARGDIQSDIAAFFGTNGGRICEINTGQKYADVPSAAPDELPPPGPYMAARSAIKVRETLQAIFVLLRQTLLQLDLWEIGRDVVEPGKRP